MMQIRLLALALIFGSIGLGVFLYTSEKGDRFNFKFGLDLSGGTHLVYKADTSTLSENDIAGSMAALRDTIERRVNLFGVSEPIVQTEKSGILGGEREERLVVELPGVTDTQEAIRLIGQTPVLDFRLLTSKPTLSEEAEIVFEPTGLTGRYVTRATLEFGASSQQGGLSNEPIIVLAFNAEGGDLFQKITRENVGETLGIFLDGQLISNPIINEEIPNGTATISGGFSPEDARTLVRNLNFGALPVPIELLSTQTIGATLGGTALASGLFGGVVGLIMVGLFLVLWYRLPGILAVVSLCVYIVLMLAVFKLLPVTLTVAGIAGFILSLGLAVDANVLIFERMKEELLRGKNTHDATRDGFKRAWTSIRDGNATSLITAVILFWFGTSLVEGFALVFGIGVVMSMFSAITVTRIILFALGNYENRGFVRFLFGSGFKL